MCHQSDQCATNLIECATNLMEYATNLIECAINLSSVHLYRVCVFKWGWYIFFQSNAHGGMGLSAILAHVLEL